MALQRLKIGAAKDVLYIRKRLRFSSSTPQVSIMHTRKVLSKQAQRIAQHADKHETFLNKVTYCLGVLSFGLFCYLLGSSPQDIPRLYCLFFIFVIPLRWMHYRVKKWHYFLLDFCYYANLIFVSMLMFYPNNKKLFMLCFSFSEGPLAWALIVWRCSLVFSSIDKIISVLIHLLPGTVFFILRWWDTKIFSSSDTAFEEVGTWPVVNSVPTLWTWLFFVPLVAYSIWQGLYFLVVEGLKRQRILRDPEIMTSYRELKRKAERANNIWWRLSGLLGAENRVYMYAIIQAAFTIATLALTVPMFKSYRLHIGFEVFKLAATVWNGGNFVFEVMPRQAAAKKLKKESLKCSGGLNSATGLDTSSNMPAMVNQNQLECVESFEGADNQEQVVVCALCRKQSRKDLLSDSPTSERRSHGGDDDDDDDIDAESETSRILRFMLNSQEQTLQHKQRSNELSVPAGGRGTLNEWKKSPQVSCVG